MINCSVSQTSAHMFWWKSETQQMFLLRSWTVTLTRLSGYLFPFRSNTQEVMMPHFSVSKSTEHLKRTQFWWPGGDLALRLAPSSGLWRYQRPCHLVHCHISVLGQCITEMNISVRWGKVMFWCNYHLLLPVIVSDLFWTIISWWTSGAEPSSLFIVLHSGKTQLNWGLSY